MGLRFTVPKRVRVIGLASGIVSWLGGKVKVYCVQAIQGRSFIGFLGAFVTLGFGVLGFRVWGI